MLLRLVQLVEGRDDVRRQQPVAALRSAGSADEVRRTLELLTERRLLTLSGAEGADTTQVDLAHEALISGWPSFQTWIAERRTAEQTRRRLEAKASEWRRRGQDAGGLLDEVELLEAERWLDGPDAAELGADEGLAALAQASEQALDQARREREADRQRELAQARELATRRGLAKQRWLPWRRRRRAMPSEPPEPPSAPARPARPGAGDGVAFTAAYPGVTSPQVWYSLSIYIHLDRLQAEADELITRRSPQFGLWPAVSRAAPFASLLRGTAVRVIPEVQGVVFNPPSQDVIWLEELQEVSFRLQAGSDAAGRAVLGAVAVCVGPLLVTQIPLSIRVRGASEREEHIEALASTTTQMFSKIFASYAHEDDRVVRAFAETYRALGIDMLVDKQSLHAGEPWQETLLKLIEDADLFQLFWSEAASRSVNVAKEWEHALSLQGRRGERFIRPVYWQSPWPPPPTELAHLHFASLDLAALSSIAGR